jgi:hypothetical protein
MSVIVAIWVGKWTSDHLDVIACVGVAVYLTWPRKSVTFSSRDHFTRHLDPLNPTIHNYQDALVVFTTSACWMNRPL